MELQQSPLFAQYLTKLGWKIIPVGKNYIVVKNIPFMCGLAKIQRLETLPAITQLLPILKRYGIKTLAVEPAATVTQTEFTEWIATLKPYVHINTSAYLATKTRYINLTPPAQAIFKQFTQAKQRAIRKANRNGVRIIHSEDIGKLISIKNSSAGFLGFITTFGIKELWQVFAPAHAAILLAYSEKNQLVGGVLLIVYHDLCYYWIAGASKAGKKLFAPTALVWEALKLAKTRHCKTFDFVGVWDERLPHENTSWHGFTKFKEGFGGQAVYYPISATAKPHR